jgi:hypothetical protein
MHIKIPPYPRRVQLDFNFNLIQTTITGKVQQSGRLNVWFNMVGGGATDIFREQSAFKPPGLI